MKKYAIKKRDVKILISGEIIEIYEYQNPVPVEKREYEILKGTRSEEGKRIDNLNRARANIRRYIWSNITQYSKFLTLTYANTELNQDNVLYDFKQFVKNMKRSGYIFPWLFVTEHQKERGLKEGNAGSLHIHAILFFDDLIPFQIINKCWKKGNTKINCIDSVNNVGAYVCKYLTKDEFELFEKNSYHISRGLKKSNEYCHDGYISDYDFAEIVKKNANFNYINTRSYEIETASGTICNTVTYYQGKITDKSIMQNVIDNLNYKIIMGAIDNATERS